MVIYIYIHICIAASCVSSLTGVEEINIILTTYGVLLLRMPLKVFKQGKFFFFFPLSKLASWVGLVLNVQFTSCNLWENSKPYFLCLFQEK